MNVRSRKFSILALVAVVGVILFSFQNCAPPKTNSGFQSSTAGLNGQSSPSTFSDSQKFSVGRCGDEVNTCEEGVYVNVPDTSSLSVWNCVGTGGGSSIQCSTNFSNAPVEGICSSSVNQCVQGQPVDLPDTSATEAKWECRGFNDGISKTCTSVVDVTMPKQDGVCGSALNTCNPGAFADVQDVGNQLLWVCNGINGGAPAPAVCKITVLDPNAPLCDSVISGCLNDSALEELPDGPTSFLWKCGKAGYTPVTCNVPKPVCVVSVESRTHYLERYTYKVTVTSGSLPSSVDLAIYGTKTKLDGTGVEGSFTVPLSTVSNVSTNPLTLALTNSGGTMAGIYRRSFGLVDRVSGAELCRTNIVDQTLTPRCDLSFDKSSINTVETFVATFDFAVPGEQLQPVNPVNVIWYGKKNGQDDEIGQTGYSISVSSGKATKTLGPFSEGSYQRYFIAKGPTGADLCKSEPKNYSVVFVPRVDGACTSATHALELNTCASGNPIETGTSDDTAVSYIWKCQGAGGGITATCSKTKPQTNTCGGTPNNCITGANPSNYAFVCATGVSTWSCTETSTGYVTPCSNQGAATCETGPIDPPIIDECETSYGGILGTIIDTVRCQ